MEHPKMFSRGMELMSAEEIVVAYGPNEKIEITAEEYAYYETLKQRDTAMKIRVELRPFYDYDSGDNIDHQPSMSYEVAICEACNTDVGRTDDNFCPNCGQRLDWGK